MDEEYTSSAEDGDDDVASSPQRIVVATSGTKDILADLASFGQDPQEMSSSADVSFANVSYDSMLEGDSAPYEPVSRKKVYVLSDANASLDNSSLSHGYALDPSWTPNRFGMAKEMPSPVFIAASS